MNIQLRAIVQFSLIIVLLFSFANSKTKQDLLDEKVNQMVQWSNRKSVINLGSSKFNNYVKSKPRNYSVIVMFTALNPKRGCSVCQEASDEFTVLANSFRFSSSYSHNLFFGLVDFDEGGEAFQALGLNSAPAFIHFPAKGKRKSADTYEIQRLGFQAETIAKWMAERTEIKVQIFRPPNYTGTVVLVLLFTLAAAFLYLQRSSLEFMKSKRFWGLLAICSVLVMTSGQMWNHIRGAPYFHRNPHNGAIHYIHGSSQGQLIVESHIIVLIHAAIVFGFILLNEAGNVEIELKKRKISVVSGLALVVFFLSLLISIFKRKYHGYPYSLLLP